MIQRKAFKPHELTDELKQLEVAVTADETKEFPVYKEFEGAAWLPAFKRQHVSDKETLDTDFSLRDYQEPAVAKAVDILHHAGNLFLKAPCGTGKTVMTLAIIEVLQYQSIIVLVDQKKLADQWEERVEEFLPSYSTEVFHSQATSVDELRNSKANIKLVVAQSLMTRDWFDDPVRCDLLVCDEAHVFSAPRFCESIFNIDYANSLALTATENRKDGLTWVFMRFLAANTVVVEGKTMKAKVVMPKVRAGSNMGKFCTAFCVEKKQLTWYSKCEACELFENFPYCGKLRRGPGYKGVAWNSKKIMWTPMLSSLFKNPEYMDLFLGIILKFHKAGRNMIVFNQFTQPLKDLQEMLAKKGLEDEVGLFISGTKEVDEELSKPITLATYKIAQKGLDVPAKDAAILMSPVSDIEQTVGRVTRVKAGKKQPLIFDPIITDNPLFQRQSYKRIKQYKELGFEL